MNDVKQLAPPPLTLLAETSLFLDFDGTMVTLADTPDAVKVPSHTHRLLTALDGKLRGRLAIVSGRDVETLRTHFGLADFTIAGSHGAEIGLKGQVVSAPRRADGLDKAIARLQTFAAAHAGVVVEDKPLGVGLHYRLAPQKADACRAIANKLVDEFGFSLQHGKMMFELRGETADKGMAITALMKQQDFISGKPVFIGDDITDENGFRAASALGGLGIKVGSDGQTWATHALPDVAAVHRFLKRCVENEVD